MSTPAPSVPSAATDAAIARRPRIGRAETVYEVTGDLASFGYDDRFHERLGSWLDFWEANTPESFGPVHRVWGLGAHADGRVSEAHNAGRGFDLTRLVTVHDGVTVRRFSARRDVWVQWPPAQRVAEQRRYWATVASFHHHFGTVVTYAHDPDHANHVHVDDLRGDPTGLEPASVPHVRHVQACLRHVWDLGTAVDGVWGAQTLEHSRRVLRAVGAGDGSLETLEHWLGFNRHTLRRGYGTQGYPAP